MRSHTALLSIFLILSTCLSRAQSQAHTGPSYQLWNYPDCGIGAPEAFALGNVRADGSVIDEQNDMLEFASPVFPALCVMTVSYITTIEHHVQGVDMQMGSGLDVIMEWAMWLDIYTPDGHQYRLRMQFDKHTDARGNQVRYFPVSWDLPIGTDIVIRRPSVICVGKPKPGILNPTFPDMFSPYNQESCITGQSITLVGK